MKFSIPLAVALAISACNSAELPPLSDGDAQSPTAPVPTTPYKPVMAGTAAHAPVGLKPWRELNDNVAPGAGRSP